MQRLLASAGVDVGALSRAFPDGHPSDYSPFLDAGTDDLIATGLVAPVQMQSLRWDRVDQWGDA